MALKKRSVVSPAAGAVTLPTLMAELPGTRRLEELPLDRLSPAPTEWNFYAPLPDDKLLELIESIQTNELLHPIVVWKQPDGALMILSGHNRVRAYTALLEKTGEEKYRRIPATVLTDITADEAHEIVVDSNYVQRVLTPSEKARSISQKYALAGRKKRSKNGERKSKYEQIGEEYNLSGRQIARYVRLGSLDKSLLALLDGGKLPLTTALRLVDFAPDSRKFAAGMLAARDGQLSCSVYFMSTDADTEGPVYTAQQGSMLLRLDWQSESRVMAVFDTYIAVLDPRTGTETARYDFGGATLQSAAPGRRQTALLLNVRGGNSLVTLDENLAAMAEIPARQAFGVSATDTDIYLLCPNAVECFGYDGVQKWVQSGLDARPLAVLDAAQTLVFTGSRASVLEAPN